MSYEGSSELVPSSRIDHGGSDVALGATQGRRRPKAPVTTASLLGPPLIVVAVLIGLQLAYSVSLGDALLYVGYEVCFAVIPGWLLYRALSHRPGGWLRQLALGWGLGYVLQILAFMLTAGAGARNVFVAYPVVVSIPAALAVIRKGTTAQPRVSLPVNLRWLVSAVCVVATAYVAVAYFRTNPLPGSQAVHYHPDYPWALSLAADAKHHWPIQDPNVAGLPMPYHYFVHVHLASASQVTGLPLPLIFLRLYLLPLIVLITLQIVVAGQSLARSAYAGLVAACLVLLVGQVNLTHDGPLSFISFLGVFPTYLYASPSFPFGLIMLLPLLVLIGEAISLPKDATRVGDWVLIALFMIGASDAKVVILPMIVLSLFLYAGGHLLVRRRIPLAVPIAGGLAMVVFSAVYVLQYRGHSSGVEFDPSSGVRLFNEKMLAVAQVRSYVTGVLPSFPGSDILVSSGGIVFGAFGLFAAQLIGLLWLFAHQRFRVKKRQAWVLAFLCTGVIVVLVSDSPGTGNVLYLLAYGTVAGCILAADGLQLAWRSRPQFAGNVAKRSVVLGLAGIGVLGAAMIVPARLQSATTADGIALTYLWAYAGLAGGLIFLVVFGGRWFRHGRRVAAWVATAVVVMAGLLGRPIELAKGGLRPIESTEVGRRMTPELYGAMVWIRDNTPGDAVIAVNNEEALEFGYAAFSERRTFLGGWGYSLPVRESGYASVSHGLTVGAAGSAGGYLFAPRVSLNDSTFRRADPRAISVLEREYGVRYLLVDEINGFPADLGALLQVAQPVYQAPGVMVLELESR